MIEGWSVSQKEAIRAKLQIVFNLGNNARDKSRIGLWHEHDMQRFEELLNEIEAITKGKEDK